MYFLRLFRYPLLLLIILFLSSCYEKTKEEKTYGQLRVVNIKAEQPRLLWPGSQFISLDTKAYYKNQKINFKKLAAEVLTGVYKMSGNVELMQIQPAYLQKTTLFYCKLASDDKVVLCFLADDGDKLSLIPLALEDLKAPLPILQEMDSIGNYQVFYGSYIINEQRQQVERKLPVISRYYTTGQDDSTNYDSFANTLYSVSPDHQMIVRSFYPHKMDADPQLITLFVTDIHTGKSKEFPLQVDGKNIVKLLNEYTDHETARQWFNRSFRWVISKREYTIELKGKTLL